MIIAVLLCITIVSLAIQCERLKRALERTKCEAANSDRLFRETWTQWTKTQDRLRKAHADRNLWRDKWKAGAFEMDAATMSRLADDDGDAIPQVESRRQI